MVIRKENIMKQKFNVTGMTCSACSAAVEKNVNKLDGTSDVNVNLVTNTMTVEYDEEILTDSDIIETVEKTGYGASIFTKSTESTMNKDKTSAQIASNHADEEEKELKNRVIISFIFLIPLFYIAMGPMINLPIPSWLVGHENAITFAFTQFVLTLPIVFVNRKYYSVGFKTLFSG